MTMTTPVETLSDTIDAFAERHDKQFSERAKLLLTMSVEAITAEPSPYWRDGQDLDHIQQLYANSFELILGIVLREHDRREVTYFDVLHGLQGIIDWLCIIKK